jgi:hypothetical protein
MILLLHIATWVILGLLAYPLSKFLDCFSFLVVAHCVKDLIKLIFYSQGVTIFVLVMFDPTISFINCVL